MAGLLSQLQLNKTVKLSTREKEHDSLRLTITVTVNQFHGDVNAQIRRWEPGVLGGKVQMYSQIQHDPKHDF